MFSQRSDCHIGKELSHGWEQTAEVGVNHAVWFDQHDVTQLVIPHEVLQVEESVHRSLPDIVLCPVGPLNVWLQHGKRFQWNWKNVEVFKRFCSHQFVLKLRHVVSRSKKEDIGMGIESSKLRERVHVIQRNLLLRRQTWNEDVNQIQVFAFASGRSACNYWTGVRWWLERWRRGAIIFFSCRL